MTTIELTKSGIAMKKLRGDPEKYLNERRRDILRYVESKGSWPISQNWRKYGFTVAEIVGRIRKGGNEPNWINFPSSFELIKMEYLYQTSSVLRRRRLQEQVKIHGYQ